MQIHGIEYIIPYMQGNIFYFSLKLRSTVSSNLPFNAQKNPQNYYEAVAWI